MKLIVYMLSALLLFSSVSAGESSSRQQVDLSQLDSDPNLSDALKDGINFIFQHGANKYGVSDSNIQVTTVNSIESWEENGKTYYAFDVEATNNDDATVESTYTVKCGSSGRTVTQWKYHITYEDNPDNDNQDNKQDETQDEQQNDEEEECEVTNTGEDVEINVEDDVETEPTEENCVEVEVEAEEDCEEAGNDDNNTDDQGTDNDENEDQEVEVDVEDCEEEEVEETDDDNQEDNTEVEVEVDVEEDDNDDDRCVAVEGSDIDNDENLQDALNFGVNWIFEKASQKYDVSCEGVEVTQVNSVCSWEENGDIYYTFDVDATNNYDANVQGTFTVKYDCDSGNLRVVNQWSYDLDRLPTPDDNDNNTDDDQETDNNEDCEEEEVVDEDVCVEEEDTENDDNDNNTDDDEEPNNNEDCEEEDIVDEDACEVEVEVEEEENNNSCVPVDVSEVDSDSNLKNALEYGIVWIFGRAGDKYGVSDDNIVVTRVNSICTWEEDGDTYYTFDVEANNGDGDVVTATYSVREDCDSGALKVVNEWNYDIQLCEDRPEENDVENDNNTDDQGNDDEDDENVEQEVEVDVEIDIEEDCEEEEDDVEVETQQNEEDC